MAASKRSADVEDSSEANDVGDAAGAALGSTEPSRQTDRTGGTEDVPDHPGARSAFPDIAELGYEQARDELVSIVARLESGQIALEDSMTLWQRGEALAEHCSTWLDGAEATLTAATVEPK